MTPKTPLLRGALLALALSLHSFAHAAPAPVDADAPAVQPDARWKVWGGTAGIRFSHGLFDDLGVVAVPHDGAKVQHRGRDALQFAVGDAAALDFDVVNGNFAGFTGGSLAIRGGYDLQTPGGLVRLRDFRLVPRADDRFVLDLVGGDGVAWMYADKMMYEVEGGASPVLVIRTMDLRIAPALAERLGHPELAGNAVADVWMTLRIHASGRDLAVFQREKGAPTGRWHGAPVPGVPGATYQADVFMHHFFGQYWRREATTDGTGPGDGAVVFAPSSTLRNNRNNGTRVNTFPTLSPPAGGAFTPAPGSTEPGFETRLNASTALYTAHIPWYTKFDDNNPPHNNDQHPYLIWNLYRIDANGVFEQIARSGVKHAWLTTNSPCDEAAPSSHVLARGCADTYSAGNNDEYTDLGPRNEIVPAQGLWGRCGSVYDKNCDGIEDAGAPCTGPSGTALTQCRDYGNRMLTREHDIDPTRNAGAVYWYESWYIVRDDINIYNTMQNRPVTFSWLGSSWDMDDGLNTQLRLGPAIDRWVAPDTTASNERNSELVDEGGRSKVAVKVVPVAGGYRYDYAVMNFDFARAVTQGAEPNLRVLSNDGFIAFSVPVAATLPIDAYAFSDGDTNPANDWVATREGNRVVWRAPAGNALNWGTMFRFSLVTAASPVEAVAVLTTAETSSVEELQTPSLVPQSDAVQTYAVGGTLTGLAEGAALTIRLNNGAPLVLDADGAFVFSNEILDGGAYTVTLVAIPETQRCDLFDGTGTVEGADVTDVRIECEDLPPPTFTIGGSASGLPGGRSVTLTLNGAETLVHTGNGNFAFETLLVQGDAYAVTLDAQPADRRCTVQNGSGIALANVTDVRVVCTPVPTHSISAAITGLSGQGSVELRLNGGELQRRSSDGTLVFQTRVQEGGSYLVEVTAQPPGRVCSVSDGGGTVGTADVTVAVSCVAAVTYAVGGNLSGLPSGQTVTLLLDGSSPTTLTINGAFNFATRLADGASYAVTVQTQPSTSHCTVANGSGVVAGADVRDVRVTCAARGERVYGDGFE